MMAMFFHAESFNHDLSKWDVSSVTDMERMFTYAVSFRRKLCGATWVHSKAGKDQMFAESPGSIARVACKTAPSPATTQVTSHYATRRPLPERELIVRTPTITPLSTSAFTSTILSTMTCPKCGTFGKSGRVSCCAPGGAWYQNCGGATNENVHYRWSEGAEACKRKSEAYGMLVIHHGLSACYNVSLISVFDQCSHKITSTDNGNDHQFRMPQMRHR